MENGYQAIQEKLLRRLEEPAPGRVQVLTGPRQVGKTGILLEIARRWGESAIYLALDAPEALLPGWWELQWRNALQKARAGKTLLLLDEAQYFPDWSRLVKVSIDQVYRSGLPLHIVVTGSATLQVGAGTRETMAGRFERLALRQWLPRDIADIFALSREEAVRQFVRSGSFPGGVPLLGDRMRWKAYLRDSIIDPAVGRDLLMLELVRKPALLRQIFAICVEHPSEILSLNKIAGSILDPGALETIAHYLGLLEETYLVSAVRKFSQKEIRRRASPPKVIPLSNAFLSASLSGDPPLPETHPALWGRWVENACLAFAVNCEQSVHYWREEPLEVDAVLTGSWGLWAVEIKTGGYTAKDLTGLLEFCRRWPEYRPLVLCDLERIDTARRLGIACLPWQDFLWQGL